MAQPFLGEIRIFGGNFEPIGWRFCNGQLLPISENDALFNLIGTTYGGDGQATFALPNLQSRVPMHQGSGFVIGQVAGTETVTLSTQQIPAHTHSLLSTGAAGTTNTPSNTAILADTGPAGIANITTYKVSDGTSQVNLSPSAIGVAGGNQPHQNMQPFLAISFIIATSGFYPSQT